MHRWFDDQFEQKILDCIYCATCTKKIEIVEFEGFTFLFRNYYRKIFL